MFSLSLSLFICLSLSSCVAGSASACFAFVSAEQYVRVCAVMLFLPLLQPSMRMIRQLVLRVYRGSCFRDVTLASLFARSLCGFTTTGPRCSPCHGKTKDYYCARGLDTLLQSVPRGEVQRERKGVSCWAFFCCCLACRISCSLFCIFCGLHRTWFSVFAALPHFCQTPEQF